MGGNPTNASTYFNVAEPKLERWNFTWFEDYFARDENKPSLVSVASKAYRRVVLYEPGEYQAVLDYYNGTQTTATWTVRPLAEQKKAKNVIMFIGDGMTTSMITAARLIGRKAINGKYQSKMAMDNFPVLGHQMTHSLETFITDSANSASALYSGHKSSVNAMGVYTDSSPSALDDPKVETLVEMLTRIWGSSIGIVSTASVADATPIALIGHSRSRYTYAALVDQLLNGVRNATWGNWNGPDVVFGGGAETFLPGEFSFEGKDYVQEFRNKGYTVANSKADLGKLGNGSKALGLFCTGHMPVWLDRNIYTENIANLTNSPTGNKQAAIDLPGLKDMTLKAIDILHARSGDRGFFMMAEAASIDKQMHALDYDRALGELLEFDDTINATIEKLKALGELENTLVLVTADHGHGFDVYGGVDTKYMASKNNSRDARDAIGAYEESGESMYQVQEEGVSYNTGSQFPLNWTPRYTLAQGTVAFPDKRENYQIKEMPRAVGTTVNETQYANPSDGAGGVVVNGTLHTKEEQGVHSLTDVPVYAMGPCALDFGGTYDNTDVFAKMASCLGLARRNNATGDLAELRNITQHHKIPHGAGTALEAKVWVPIVVGLMAVFL